ncbi:MAG TPA: DUF3800 domain-containing protein [Opitutaceae bacterium]|nr:DUF3800 domain-containing protein [Opitutaceae bacterium]
MALRKFIYADESGTHGTGPFCLVAGYRGSPGQWKEFRKEWAAILRKPDYRIKEFHSNVFFTRHSLPDERNPYRKWTDERANRFIGELIMVIRHRNIYPIGAAIELRDWNKTALEIRQLLAGYMSDETMRKGKPKSAPYLVAFKVILEDAAFETDPDTQLHFLFARQQEYQKRADEAFHIWKERGPGGRQAREIAWDYPIHWPQLQAADLLAYQWNNWLSRGDLNISRQNRLLMEQLTDKRDNMLVLDEGGIERQCAVLLAEMENRGLA